MRSTTASTCLATFWCSKYLVCRVRPSYCSPTFLNKTAIRSIYSISSLSTALVIYSLSLASTYCLRSVKACTFWAGNLFGVITPTKAMHLLRCCDAISISCGASRHLRTCFRQASSAVTSLMSSSTFVALRLRSSSPHICLLMPLDKSPASSKNVRVVPILLFS